MLTKCSEWKELSKHWKKIESKHLRELFAADPQRAETFSLTACDLLLDYSKNRITDETLCLLVDLADVTGLRAKIEAMFTGAKINRTENQLCKKTTKGSKINRTQYSL